MLPSYLMKKTCWWLVVKTIAMKWSNRCSEQHTPADWLPSRIWRGLYSRIFLTIVFNQLPQLAVFVNSDNSCLKPLCKLQICVISTGLVTLETSRPWEETNDLCVKTHKIPLGLKKDIFEAHCERSNKAIRARKLYSRPRTRTSARGRIGPRARTYLVLYVRAWTWRSESVQCQVPFNIASTSINASTMKNARTCAKSHVRAIPM